MPEGNQAGRMEAPVVDQALVAAAVEMASAVVDQVEGGNCPGGANWPANQDKTMILLYSRMPSTSATSHVIDNDDSIL